MTKPGPPKKPTQLKLLEGGRVTDHPINEPLPPTPYEVPGAPTWLNKRAKQKWAEVAPVLWAIGTLKLGDEAALGAYCMAFARYVQAEIDYELIYARKRVVKKAGDAIINATHGVVIETTNGNAIQNPMLGAINTLRKEVDRLGRQFGLTPAARTEISAGPAPKSDPAADEYGLA